MNKETAEYYFYVSEREACSRMLAKMQGIYKTSYPIEVFQNHYRRTAETLLIGIPKQIKI